MTTHAGDGTAQGGTGTTFTVPVASVAGEGLVVWVTQWISTNTPTRIVSVSDNASGGSNTWTYSTATASQNPPANGSYDANAGFLQYGFTAIGVCLPSSNGGTTKAVTSVTVTLSGSGDFAEVQVSRFAGLPAGSAVLGAASSGTLAHLVTSYTTPSVTAASGSPVLVLVNTSFLNGQWTGASSGYTIVSYTDALAAYNLAATAGTLSCTLTAAVAEDVPSSAILVIGAPSGAEATGSLLPVLPQIIVEAGVLPDAPAQGGTTLFLDDPALGLLDTATLGTAITWADISAWVISFTITRPSTRLQGPLWNYQAGTVSVLLDNSDGRFDPDNLAGPYTLAGATQLVPMVPVRVRSVFASVAYSQYSGFADGWLPGAVTYEGGYAEITLPATDAFKVLAGITLPAVAIEGIAADAGARVRDILLRAGWYTSAERLAVSTGNSQLQGTTLGADPLSLMQIAVDSEIGQLYVSGAGAVVFRARRDLLTDARSNTVQAVFGDLPGTAQTAGTELAYAAIGRADDDTTIANDVQATRAGSTSLQEVKDTASIAKYLFPRTYARTDLILQNDSDALNWAQWVLYVSKGGEDRIETLAVDPAADPANLWPQVLGREIGDRIQVWHRPASLAAPIAKDCFIAGIAHTWDSAASAWLTTWTLQDASKYGSFLTLDNPALGKLDANALTF